MASEPITGLPAAAALTGTDPLVTVQGGVTVKSDVDAMKAFMDASPIMQFKGQADASAVDEDAATGTSIFQTGDIYRINVAASAPHAFSDISEDLLIGDWVVFNGSIFQKQDGTDPTAAETKTAYESNADTNAFDDAAVSKLGGIEALADVTDTANVDAAGAVMETDYNAQTVLLAVADDTPLPVTVAASSFVGRKAAGDVGTMTAAEARTVLNVENGATADQTDAEIKTAYENNADTNEFSDAELAKLAGIETSADVTRLTNMEQAGAVVELDYSFGSFDLANASFDTGKEFLMSTEDGAMQDIHWNVAGTKAYGLGSSNDKIFQYTASSAFDPTTLSVDVGKEISLTSLVAGLTGPVGFNISDDGLKMFIIDGITMTVYQFAISDPTDISTTTYTGNFIALGGSETSWEGIFVRPDYRKFYVVGASTDKVYQWDLSNPDDISTAVDTGKFLDVSGQDGSATGISFRHDGLKAFLIGLTNDKVYQFTLDNPWELDAGTVNFNSDFSVSSETGSPRDIFVTKDGLTFFTVDVVNDKMFRYSITTEASVLMDSTGDGNPVAKTMAEARILLNVENGATADQTGAEIKTAYEAEANAYTDTKDTKLAGIEDNATADQSDAEIKTAYENNADTNVFSDNDVLAFAITRNIFLEDLDVTVTSNGTVITLSIEREGGGDLTISFSDGYFVYDTTPADTVSLAVGTDTVPVENFIFIPQSTKVLTANTTGFPTSEHMPVATVVTQGAASAQTDGVFKVQIWEDHAIDENNNSHISHISRWIREQNATWLTGVTPTITGTGTATIEWANIIGTVLQLHEHTFPAFSAGSDMYVVNDPDTPYRKITDITDLQKDSVGDTLLNRTYGLVIWGVVSEDGSDSKIFINLPSGSEGFNKPANVRKDNKREVNFGIPDIFKNTGFLIHRLVLDANSGGTVWTVHTDPSDDLRGYMPNAVAGISTEVGTEFSDSVFRVFNNADDTKVLALDASAIATGTTRTLIIPNSSGPIALTNLAQEYTKQQGFNETTLTALGPDLVINGGFVADTDWTKGTGWTIAAGVASSDASQAGDSDLTQSLSLVSGKTYEVEFTISNYSAGNATPVAGDTEGTDRAANGTFTENIIAGAGGDIDIRADLDFVGDIDDVTVKLANVSWDLNDNQVTKFTLDGNLVLDNPTNQQAGTTYIVTLTQDGVGSRTLSYGSVYKFPGGTAPTLSIGVNDVDIISFVSDGTNMYGVFQGDFS